MNTCDRLQQHLNTEVIKVFGDYTVKTLAPVVQCKDGTTLSVQASALHYSTPRENTGPYSAVEVWCIRPEQVVTEFLYTNEPAAWVPIEAVVAFIGNHGGMV